MRKVSEKRKEKLKEYHKVCDEIRADLDKRFCVFCDRPVDEHGDIHHLDGRDGDLLTDPDNLFLAHRSCHSDYHHLSLAHLIKNGWYFTFLGRLKGMNSKVYIKQLNRLDKANIEY